MKTAVISVSDKSGIPHLTNFLLARDFIIYSTGGTYKTILESLKTEEDKQYIKKISELTDFNEILNGRVKTLHPHVFAGLLADKDNADHTSEMSSLRLPYIDVLVCNLYPFLKEPSIENIDIGGVSLMRAAAKNYKHTVILSKPKHYHSFIINYNDDDDNLGISLERRKQLAFEVFNQTQTYDAAIASYFSSSSPKKDNKLILKYGMNPQQSETSVVFREKTPPFIKLNGTLGMINVIDVLHGWLTVKEVDTAINGACAISMKHTSLAGLAIGRNISKYTLHYFGYTTKDTLTDVSLAFMKSRTGDPLSSFGDFICISRVIDKETALLIKREVCDGIAAPGYSEDALNILKTKKSGKFIILQMSDDYYNKYTASGWKEKKELYGVCLTQNNNQGIYTFDDVENTTLRENLILANCALKYAQSNNISIVCDGQIIGMGCGQQNRVGCVRLAGEKSHQWLMRQTDKAITFWSSLEGKRQTKVNALYDYLEHNPAIINYELHDLVLASDGFFPFADNIEVANRYHINHIIHPGGSIADNIVKEACDKHKIKTYITGQRMFYH